MLAAMLRIARGEAARTDRSPPTPPQADMVATLMRVCATVVAVPLVDHRACLGQVLSTRRG